MHSFLKFFLVYLSFRILFLNFILEILLQRKKFLRPRPDGNFSLCEEKFPYLQKKPILPAFLCVKKGTKKPECVGQNLRNSDTTHTPNFTYKTLSYAFFFLNFQPVIRVLFLKFPAYHMHSFLKFFLVYLSFRIIFLNFMLEIFGFAP